MIVCFAMFMAAVVACLVLGKSLVWAILWGLWLFFVLGLRRGYSARDLAAMAWKKSILQDRSLSILHHFECKKQKNQKKS